LAADGLPSRLLPLDEALALIGQAVRPVAECETLPLESALGRALAGDVIAPRALPPFDNTAVDGYAFRHADAGSGALRLSGESAAGIPFSGTVPQGAAVRISTGAVLPQGADTVAMQEDCRVADGAVTMDPVPPKGANVRYAGNDIGQGAVALEAGHRLRAQDIALAGALGLIGLPVLRRLRVAVMSTGEELRAAGAALGTGQIADTNSLMLAQLLAHFPADVTILPALPDDRAMTEAALADAGGKYDLILTTGGVSVGDHDHVRPALISQGKAHFWRLALRPGKPVLFGEVGGAFMLGLPGNPVSAMVTFLIVAVPVVNALLGARAQPLPGFTVKLGGPLRKPQTLREFARARLEWIDGVAHAMPYRDQSSNLLTSLTWADGLLDLPAGFSEFRSGDMVIYRPFSTLLI
jgi:molybdopterin molybdotransferase